MKVHDKKVYYSINQKTTEQYKSLWNACNEQKYSTQQNTTTHDTIGHVTTTQHSISTGKGVKTFLSKTEQQGTWQNRAEHYTTNQYITPLPVLMHR